KVDEGSWYPGHVVPIVYFRITKDTSLPSINDIKNIECLKIGLNKATSSYKYRGKILNTSKKIIPKTLMYMGNSKIVHLVDEYIPEYDVSYSSFDWKQIEEIMIRKYERYIK
ncbi:MAG: hypothetical protein HFG28_15560, partial [Eubacterium sp.]|nr:hypothetical protein [Eubacterium sp.]